MEVSEKILQARKLQCAADSPMLIFLGPIQPALGKDSCSRIYPEAYKALAAERISEESIQNIRRNTVQLARDL